jgi:lactate dehydrogenase-like 2-hydroxyacid dehydrogenase
VVDFLVVACPGGPATRISSNARVLRRSGEGHADQHRARLDRRRAGAVQCAADGTIKGAGLDVFDDEPHVPRALLAMDNVVLLPHVGSATRETRQAMGDLCKANLDKWFAERAVLTLVPEL